MFTLPNMQAALYSTEDISTVGQLFGRVGQNRESDIQTAIQQNILDIFIEEIKNPLSVIKIALALIKLNGEGSFESIKRMEEQVNSITDFIKNFEQFLLNGEQCTCSDINIQAWWDTFTSSLDCSEKITITPFKSKGYLFSNSFILNKIMGELVANAVKYTPEPGQIKLSITATQHSYKFIVENQAVIPEKEIPLIWHRYYQCYEHRGNKQGRGQGLFLVQKLTKLINGKINVFVKDGRTHFVLNIYKKQVA